MSRQIGIGVELLGLTALVIFVAYVYTRTRAAGWLAVAALAGGTITFAVKFASVAPWITPYLLRDEMIRRQPACSSPSTWCRS